VKVDQQIINNLIYNENLYRNRKYEALDNIIMAKCLGCRIPAEYNEIWRELIPWMYSKKNEIELWDSWYKELKEDFYKEAIKSISSQLNTKNMFNSMADITEEIRNKSIEAIDKREVENFSDMVSSWGTAVKIKHDGFKSDTWDQIENITMMYLKTFTVVKAGNIDNIEYMVYVYINKILGVRGLEIRLGEAKEVIYYLEDIKINVEDFSQMNNENEYDDYINSLEKLAGKCGLHGWNRYNILKELYTGYLKYGSVDNYIKYCQEDDERVALNTKIAQEFVMSNSFETDEVTESFTTETGNVVLVERNLINEFRNQLQQKGIWGERLETAVADFVKFLEKQDEESGADTPCSEPAAPPGGT
jgi:hypothetical protein